MPKPLPKKDTYLGNPNLPTKDAKFEYTPEQAEAILNCRDDLLYFAENYFFIVDPDKGKILIPLFEYQTRLLKAFKNHRFNIINASRQIGKTTVMTILALHFACFQDYKNVVIVANKEDTAKMIFKRVKLAYEALPNWLKPGVTIWGQTGLELTNGSSIQISTTTGSAARGQAIQLLLLDELAFIEPDSIVEDFWKSVWPTISRAKTSQVLITSTPNGKNNLFFKLMDGAIRGENGFHPEEVTWREVPDRDEEWKKQQIATLGSFEAFEQEFNCLFIDDGTSGIDAELFDELKKDCKEAPIILKEGKYHIWKEPVLDGSRTYVAGVDVSEGVDQDASVIQILDITDLQEIEQVAVYHNAKIAPYEFTNEVYEILQNWGNPMALVERNNQGAIVCDRLEKELMYPNVVSWGAKVAHKNPQIGIISHTNTKHKAVLNERYFINEIRSVIFHDIHTLNEFKTFVRYPNGSWKAKSGDHDDRVMSFIWALMILYNEITEQYFEIVELDDFGKPLRIAPMEFGTKPFSNPTSIYTNEEVEKIEVSNLSPVSFHGGMSQLNDDIADLVADGWYFPGDSPYNDPNKQISQDDWRTIDSYFG